MFQNVFFLMHSLNKLMNIDTDWWPQSQSHKRPNQRRVSTVKTWKRYQSPEWTLSYIPVITVATRRRWRRYRSWLLLPPVNQDINITAVYN